MHFFAWRALRSLLLLGICSLPVHALTVDIRTFGAVSNDGRDDTAAVKAAILAVHQAGGGVVSFPAGTWDLSALTFAANKVILQGAGFQTTLRRRSSGTLDDSTPLLKSTNSTDLILQDFRVDLNRQQRFGGLKFLACTRCTVQRLLITDSAPPFFDSRYDRYGVVVGVGGIPSRDFALLNTVIEHVGVEIDHTEGVLLRGNTVKWAKNFSALGLVNHYSNTHVSSATIENNLVIDPVKTGIIVAFDYGPSRLITNTFFQQVRLWGNIVRYTVGGANAAIRLGVGDNSVAAPGNWMRDVLVEQNRIELAPGVHRSGPLLFVNNSPKAGLVVQSLSVCHNRLVSTAPPWLWVDVRQGLPSNTVTVCDNLQVAK